VQDVITGLNGRPVKNQRDLFAALDGCTVGESVEVELLTGQLTTRSARVTLGDRNSFGGQE
jgi:S1-C subfamily serine protease